MADVALLDFFRRFTQSDVFSKRACPASPEAFSAGAPCPSSAEVFRATASWPIS